MVRGAENRAKVVANAFRLLKPGGRFVLHVHNRFFRGLGWKRVLGQRLKTLLGRADAGDITMPQAYGGAPLTLHHFTRREAMGLLWRRGVRGAGECSADGDDRWPRRGAGVRVADPAERWRSRACVGVTQARGCTSVHSPISCRSTSSGAGS